MKLTNFQNFGFKKNTIPVHFEDTLQRVYYLLKTQSLHNFCEKVYTQN